MLPRELTKDIITRLQSIRGQIDGLAKMLQEGQDPEKIIIQFKASRKGLDKAHHLLLDEVYRKALALKIVETVEACPGNCGNEDKIEFLRRQFPLLEQEELTDKMKEIASMKERLDQINKNFDNI